MSLTSEHLRESVALPQMKRYDYNPGVAIVSIAAGGAIAILIPLSAGLIAYAILTE